MLLLTAVVGVVVRPFIGTVSGWLLHLSPTRCVGESSSSNLDGSEFPGTVCLVR